MGIITRIGNAPGVRRMVRRKEQPGEIRENSDDDEFEPKWCADCHREVLFEMMKCPDCGGVPVSAVELVRLMGDFPRAADASPVSWRLPPSAPSSDGSA